MNSTKNELNLATIPSDIIRMITMERPESIYAICLISRSWYCAIREHRRNKPIIPLFVHDWICRDSYRNNLRASGKCDAHFYTPEDPQFQPFHGRRAQLIVKTISAAN
ncbi:hypothetical protein PRIPAC_85383 [Pristionchus pacificus]|uniref:Uncharacterized protein n=1 Tax=Pristionchus pacificus TaxID=54126 RepID=A0A2A6BV21_PRIPA|nr:hypothetical protein PRIPAC_85383 [Pristionchus pacificus]|eukprot:PDM69707.1 hypothetical protein PRIPAC_44803 [Pristionchus pacificus]